MSQEQQDVINETQQDAAISPPEQPQDQPFFLYLSTKYTSAQLKNWFRTMKAGLFLQESQLEPVLVLYGAWLQETTGSETAKSREKCLRKLFGTENPELFYLLDGKLCLAGYRIERPLEPSSLKNIPYSPSALIDTKRYVHPRDTALSSIPGVRASFDQTKGFRFSVEVSGKQIHFTADFLVLFGDVARQLPNLVKEHPALKGALRECIPSLVSLLQKAHPAKEGQRLLVPAQYAKDTTVNFLLTESVTFVTSASGTLINCYGLNRKNLKHFVTAELAKSHSVKIPDVKIFTDDEWKLGTIKINHNLYLLHQDLLTEALLRAGRSPRLRKACVGHYTVFTCLQDLANLLSEATLVHAAKDGVPDKKSETLRYLKFRNWRFPIKGKNVIQSFEERLKPKGSKAEKK